MISIISDEFRFIENMGLLFEKSAGAKTLGRVFGYLLLSDQPKTLDDIASDLLFSKATASLTVRQGILTQFIEKVSIPGERKTYFRANIESWIKATFNKLNTLQEWEKLIDAGLLAIDSNNRQAQNNLTGMKDYFTFINWYFSDMAEKYELWKKGEIKK